MPLFSWRPRILGGRKTPDPSQAVQITIAPEPPEIPDSPVVQQQQRPRNVRFEEHSQQTNFPKVQPEWTNNFGCEARVIGTVRPEKNLTSSSGRVPAPEEPTTNDWRYADDVKVRVAPIDIDRTPPRFAQPTRASSVLQNLRDQKEHLEYDERRREVSTLPSYGSNGAQSSFQGSFQNMNQNQNQGQNPNISNQYQNNRSEIGIYGTIQRSFDAQSRTESHIPALDDMNVVFLQANDEVKRTLLPRSIMSMHQVKMSFVRTFPNVTRAFVEQPHVKIYIQEPTKGALFYELEDPNDIKNKSVLRLREKTRVTSPVGYLGEPDYHSETEQDDGRRLIPLNRPASAMAAPSLDFLQQKQQQLYGSMPQKAYDIYSDPYNSDTSSHDSRSVTRSGSATPVIDRESRVRMETMERQLAGLSNLVHTALVSKGMSETTQRDMAELRREILSMHPEHAARESSEEPGSSSLSESSISSHTAFQLSALKNALKDTQRELRQLKNSAQVNAQTGNTLLREAGDKIGKILNDRMKAPGIHVAHVQPQLQKIDNYEKEKDDVQRNEHASRLAELLHSLTNFETNVETVRGSVLSNQKKLRMSEVEEMTEKLTNIGRVAADLKTEFPPIQQQIEEQIKKDMERVVREEKFIRDQNTAVDQSLRRCKALANIMVTMKKLAMVQDPTIQRRKKESSTGSPRLPPKPSGASGTVGQSLQSLQNLPHHQPLQNPLQNQSSSLQNIQQSLQSQLTSSVPPPPPPPPPAVFYAPPSNVVKVAPMVEQPKSPISVLDNVLEEVGEPSGPPRPPSRYSVTDVRQKYQRPPELPDGLRNLIEDVARRASPGPEQIVDRRQDLEERQERLAEKQRQLRSQFQQLQQLAPMP